MKYKTILEWWDTYVKVRMQIFFKKEGRETAKEERNIEHFYYVCIYDLLREPIGKPCLATRLKFFKAKSAKTHKITIDSREPELLRNEWPTFYHRCQARRMNQARLITHIQDSAGTTHNTQEAIMRILTSPIPAGTKTFRSTESVWMRSAAGYSVNIRASNKRNWTGRSQHRNPAGNSARSRKGVTWSGRHLLRILLMGLGGNLDGNAGSVKRDVSRRAHHRMTGKRGHCLCSEDTSASVFNGLLTDYATQLGI
jgi:hypothetical protein